MYGGMPMTNEITKHRLSLIAEHAVGNIAEAVLSKEFAVTRFCQADFSTKNVTKDTKFYVIHGDMVIFTPDTLISLQHEVMNNNAVLMLCGNVPDFGLNEDFFRFVGVSGNGTEPSSSIELRIFPHYLAHGLDEYETVYSGILSYKMQTRLTTKDNVFIKNAANGTPVAFERIYGKKGRMIFISLRSTPENLDHVTLSLLKNLSKIKITADGIEGGFSPVLPDTIPFDKGIITERQDVIGRWNALYVPANGDAIYSHSSLFLPVSPEFFLDSKIDILKNSGELTRKKLFRSLSSIEIRNTDFCSEDCYYCFNRKSMDLSYMRTSIPDALHCELEDDLLDLFTSQGSSFMIRFTGSGEPLNHNRTLPSIIAFEQAGIPTALITNGSALTNKSATELGKYSTFVRFSIDAADAKTYANIRRCSSDVFNAVIRSIEDISCRNVTIIGVTFLVCRQNFTQIAEFCALVKRIGVKLVWIRSLNDPDEFSKAEIDFINEDIRRAESLNDNGFFVFALQFSIYRKVCTLHYRADDKHCWSLFTKAVIQPNGDVITCLSHKDFVLGNIHDRPFSMIWGSKRHIAFLNRSNKVECSQCIESRFNNSIEFMYRHNGEQIVKAQRNLEL